MTRLRGSAAQAGGPGSDTNDREKPALEEPVSLDCVLVTGASGFLGQRIVGELRERLESRDDPLVEIRVLDIDRERLPSGSGIKPFVGSITDPALVMQACDGADAVIHAASLVDWGNVSAETLRKVNVNGTTLLLDAARQGGVRSFVYTSSMDVVCGKDAVVDASEVAEYPLTFDNLYCETKARAEDLVLRENDHRRAHNLMDHPERRVTMRTVALRPCGMYGEADPYHVGSTLEVVRAGKLTARPGSARALFEHVYVGNVAHAHVVALDRVEVRDPEVCGRPFFITDDTPALNFLEFMEPIVEGVGLTLPPRNRRVPYPVMWTVGALSELWAKLGKPFGAKPPILTRSSVRFVCKTHTFDGSQARQAIGYTPRYSYEESLSRTIEWWRAHEAERVREMAESEVEEDAPEGIGHAAAAAASERARWNGDRR